MNPPTRAVYTILFTGTNSDYFQTLLEQGGVSPEFDGVVYYSKAAGLEKIYTSCVKWATDTRRLLAEAFPEEYSEKAYGAEFCTVQSPSTEGSKDVVVDAMLVLPGIPRTHIASIHVILRGVELKPLPVKLTWRGDW